MGLVDYGSDSDSDSGSPAPVAASASAPRPASTSSRSLLDLPPPKSALNLPPPASSTSTSGSSRTTPVVAPRKKEKGPVRIVLDKPSAEALAEHERDGGPAKKKPRLELGKGGGLSGLAAMLPKPKNEVKAPPPPTSSSAPRAGTANGSNEGAGIGDLFGTTEPAQATKPSGMFVPPSVKGKGKGKDQVKSALPPPALEEPAVDFFGIGSVASTARASSSSASTSSKPSISSAPTISSAPPTSDPANRNPTADDPYPGFTQLPSGEWVAKDQKTYEMALEWQARQQQEALDEVPRGFDEKEIANQGGYMDVDEAKRAKEAWANRPSQVLGKEDEYKKSAQVKGIPKQATQQARRKGQLSSLIAEAHDNRAELEQRIAQARVNRRSAGNKYGF
ncbi:hypothetical protein JCM10212_007137 [Sporobolomyces blumeae]